MGASTTGDALPPAFLHFPGEDTVEITRDDQLREALERLPQLPDKASVSLRRSDTDYVEATRRGEFWSASTRRGGWWTERGFTAGLTSEYSEREVRRARNAATLWERFFGATHPEIALSEAQVRRVFVAYYLGKKYDVPFGGA